MAIKLMFHLTSYSNASNTNAASLKPVSSTHKNTNNSRLLYIRSITHHMINVI